MPTKAVQQFMLGTVLSNENEARQTLAAMKAAGYDGIELCGFMIHPIGFMVRLLTKAGEALKAEGVELLYHNHNCELRHVNAEKRAYDILLEETDPQFVNFEFDSYWFTEGGANALAWMQRLGTRMKLWHINDRGTRISGSAVTPILKTDSMELGTGNMDLDSLMAQALTIGVDAVILESHRNWVDNSPIKSLQLSAEYLKQHG